MLNFALSFLKSKNKNLMMKRLAILLSITLLSLFAKAQDTEIKDWWNDLSVFQVNKMPPRTNVIPSPNTRYALTEDGNSIIPSRLETILSGSTNWATTMMDGI